MRGLPKVVLSLTIMLVASLSLPVTGASICFVELDDNEDGALYRIDPATPTPTLLVSLVGETFGMVRCPQFSPSGQSVAFSSEEDLMSTPWRSNLWITDRNGQQHYSVTHKTPGSFPPRLAHRIGGRNGLRGRPGKVGRLGLHQFACYQRDGRYLGAFPFRQCARG